MTTESENKSFAGLASEKTLASFIVAMIFVIVIIFGVIPVYLYQKKDGVRDHNRAYANVIKKDYSQAESKLISSRIPYVTLSVMKDIYNCSLFQMKYTSEEVMNISPRTLATKVESECVQDALVNVASNKSESDVQQIKEELERVGYPTKNNFAH